MLKWIVIVLLILGTLTGCFNEKENSENKAEKTSSINKEEKTTKKEINENKTTKKDSNAVNKGMNEGFQMYRPKVGMKKVFVGVDNQESLTEEIAQENNNYVQSIVRIGQSTSVIVYKWTNDEISIDTIVKSPGNPYKNYLNGIKENKNPEIMLSSKPQSKSIWKVLKSGDTVITPYKTFHNVYVIQKITNEVKGEDTIYTYYLAPQIGIVKETYQVTGNQGYTDESILQQVEE